MYYCEYAHLLKKRTEHTCMSGIYYDQESKIEANQCKTIVTYILTIYQYFQNYKFPGPLLVKMFLEYLKLNILHILFLTDRSYVNVH